MTLPLSGPLEASDINVELGRSATAVMSIKDAATGVYGAINTCSPYFPNGSAPHAYSEWYGYNHNAICLNSYYAFLDDPFSGSGKLYSLTKDYWTVVSSSRPSPASSMTISFWMKMTDNWGTNRAGLIEFTIGSNNRSLLIDWRLEEDSFNPGTYFADVLFLFKNGGTDILSSIVNLADSNNSSLTGINSGGYWDNSGNTGYVDSNGYSLITIVIDYSQYGTSQYATWYWNDTQLIVPWQPNPGNGESFTDGVSSLSNPNWTNSRLYVGGTSGLPAECQLDGFAIFLDTALNQSDVTRIYNGGAVAGISEYTNISSNLLFYNFESDTPNIGLDTGGTYTMDLDELNNPQRVQDPAL
jgi:hypothetical protein